ncbi:uncharacterized protein A4U43_C09F4130 [Asparagus officinalis]|uniref:Alpha-L-fucosidase n=1 Tax=Asparagus officinalis TaxID=4686 RepID=A0A5P1E580_ASPOF|nr:uncharacterized protein A4U43_C09F4130 [Asparagus officinalis]
MDIPLSYLLPLNFAIKMKLLHLLLLLPPLVILVSSSPCYFSSVFNFGDSNSDTGEYSAAFDPVPPPYGETFFGMPAGRYSDGRLIIDFIVKSLGLPYLSSYLDSLGTNFSHGANFATASSTIIDENVPLSQGGCPLSSGVQLKEFLQFKSRSQLVYSRGGRFQRIDAQGRILFSSSIYDRHRTE